MSIGFYKIGNGINLGSLTADPAGAQPGDQYLNTTTQKVRVFVNGAFRDHVTADDTQTLTNKVLTGNTAVNLVSGTGSTVLNTSGTVTLPSVTDTLVGKATTDTLTNKTLTSPVVSTPSVTGGTFTTPAINNPSLSGSTGALALPVGPDSLIGASTAATLTNKVLTGNTAANLVSGTGSLVLNTTGTITLPNATDTLVGNTTAATLTNKTLTSAIANTPTINNPTLNGSGGALALPAGPDSIVGASTAGTLSNKTFGDAPTITQIATPASPSAGFNKIYSKVDGNFYILSSTGVETRLSGSSIPTGSITMYGSMTAPSGYLLCDGSAVSRTTFSALFAVISTAYGVGDGTTTFNVPNNQGVFVRGAGSQLLGGVTYTGTLGAKTSDQLQGHVHTEQAYVPGGGGNRILIGAAGGSAGADGGFTGTQGPSSDGTNGTPRLGPETAPAHTVHAYIIKT